ncbi:MAG: hypothetical protein EA401_05280 [Planctomycetota bacterium]|nr:MAG: hypothetical protein EA401_05280 [Planctomycetota bacterium]
MLLQWEYCGAYDAQRSVTVEGDGQAWVQRGSYHSHAPCPQQVDMQRLTGYIESLATIDMETVEPSPMDADDGIGRSILRHSDGRQWSWAGMLPAQPLALRDCMRYLSRL